MTCLLLAAILAQPIDWSALAGPARGRVGFSARLLETGESLEFQAQGKFPMQSVYKLPIAYAVLREVDRGRFALNQAVRVEPADLVTREQHSPLRDRHPNGGVDVPLRELLRLSTSESDGTACDTLLRILGGPAQVMRHLQELRIADMAVRDTERALGTQADLQYRNDATPRAAVELLQALHESRGLSRGSQRFLLQLLTVTATGQHRIKGRLPEGTPVAHKTGTSGTRAGQTAATNDIGIVTLPGGRSLAIAVFVADSPAAQEVREAVIANMARAAYDAFVATPAK